MTTYLGAPNGAHQSASAPDPDGKPRLGLHVCCGGCATVALERLLPRFQVLPYWYNPNLSPPKEHSARLAAARRACEHFRLVLHEGPADFARWRAAVAGLEGEPEGGARCLVCFRLRLERAADWASDRGCRLLTTTLTVGPQKIVEEIHRIGEEVAQEAGLAWVGETFRKADGFRRSVELSQELGLYRQDYCGCAFSFARRELRRQ